MKYAKDILFVAGLLACIGIVFLGIWLGDEYSNIWYSLIAIGAISFGLMIYGKKSKS